MSPPCPRGHTGVQREEREGGERSLRKATGSPWALRHWGQWGHTLPGGWEARGGTSWSSHQHVLPGSLCGTAGSRGRVSCGAGRLLHSRPNIRRDPTVPTSQAVWGLGPMGAGGVASSRAPSAPCSSGAAWGLLPTFVGSYLAADGESAHPRPQACVCMYVRAQ